MTKIGVVNGERIQSLAKSLNWKEWYVLTIILEYLPCRRFVQDGFIILFDFSQLTEKNLQVLPEPHAILSNITLFHNVTKSVITQRLLRGFAGSPMAPIDNLQLLVPEGQVSPSHVAFEQNSMDVWDMKLHLSNKAIVSESSKLYQWTALDSETVDSSGGQQSAYKSKVYSQPNLEKLKQLHDIIVYGCLSQSYPTVEESANQLREKLERLYNELENVREALRSEMIVHHNLKKYEPDASYGYTEESPLTITVFDQPVLHDRALKVRTFVEPIFYRSAYRACLNAEQAHEKAADPSSASYWIAEEIESSAGSIVHSAMCLEAYINGFIKDNFPELVNDLERMELKSKWLVIPTLAGVIDCFDKGNQPFQDFSMLVGWRNELMHYKHPYSTPVEGRALGRISSLHNICNARNAKIALNATANMIRHFSNKRGLPPPNWLENATGWLEPLR